MKKLIISLAIILSVNTNANTVGNYSSTINQSRNPGSIHNTSHSYSSGAKVTFNTNDTIVRNATVGNKNFIITETAQKPIIQGKFNVVGNPGSNLIVRKKVPFSSVGKKILARAVSGKKLALKGIPYVGWGLTGLDVVSELLDYKPDDFDLRDDALWYKSDYEYHINALDKKSRFGSNHILSSIELTDKCLEFDSIIQNHFRQAKFKTIRGKWNYWLCIYEAENVYGKIIEHSPVSFRAYKTNKSIKVTEQMIIDALNNANVDLLTRAVNASKDSQNGNISDLSFFDYYSPFKAEPFKSQPYTNPVTGNAEQQEFTPIQDKSGSVTNINISTVPRPDLNGQSDKAPVPVPESSTDGKTDSETDGKTDSETDGNTDGNTDGKTDSETDGKTDGKTDDTNDLCEKHPNLPICDEKEPEDTELLIPNEDVNVIFNKDNAFSESGACPAPVKFDFNLLSVSKTFEFSLDHVCNVAIKLRPILIALAWLLAAFFCVRVIGKE